MILIKKEKEIDAVSRMVPTLFLLVCEWFFFRNMWGTDLLFGDDGDGRLTMLIAEHWFHVFQGKANISDLGMFYPAQNTLAYSDMLVGFGLVHSGLRVLGLNIYQAYKYTILLVHAIGTFICYWLLHKTLYINKQNALFGTVAFSFSDTYISSLYHSQLFALSFLPLAVIFLVCFFRNQKFRWNRNRYAYLFISVMMLILYTSWYTAFFCCIFVFTACIVGMLFCLLKKIRIWSMMRNVVYTVGHDLIGYLIFAVATSVPFVILELPMMKMSGGYSTGQIRGSIPEIIDVLHVSHSNLLLGPIFKKMTWMSERDLSPEVITGFSFVLLGTFLYSLVWSFRTKRKNMEIVQIVAIAVVVSILMAVQWKGATLCGWRFYNKLFPGGRSIRAVGRYFLFLNFPMALSTACLLEPCAKMRGTDGIRKWNVKKIISFCVLFLLLLSNVNKNAAPSRWDALTSEGRMKIISNPPEDCKSFYLKHVTSEKTNAFLQTDAYEISDRFGIPTLNGYSGVFPRGWELWNVDVTGYQACVEDWVGKNKLENVYAYLQKENQWVRIEDIDESGPCFWPEKHQIFGRVYGCADYNPSGDYSWTYADFSACLKNPDITENGLLLRVGTELDWYLKQQPDVNPECTLVVNGQTIRQLEIINGETEYLVNVPAAEDDVYTVELKCNFFFVPDDLWQSGDKRELCLKLYYLGPPDLENTFAQVTRAQMS